jgi:hypothetical protein
MIANNLASEKPQEYILGFNLFSTSQNRGKICINKAPHICIPPSGSKPGRLYQACCNDWLCPRCGEYRAKYEYGRIVEGARKLSREYTLYFVTITCKGNEDIAEAEKHYLERTNRLLSSYRAHVKKHGGFWSYASVTERQSRLHPHSHYLIASAPIDAYNVLDHYTQYCLDVERINEEIPVEQRYAPHFPSKFTHLDMFSEWLCINAVRAGLGVQTRISIVDTVEGCSRYVAKYLFKHTMKDKFPKGWKRVRYAQSYPKMPDVSSNTAFVVFTAYDWSMVARLGGEIETFDPNVYQRALLRECYNVVCNVENDIDMQKD